MKNSCLYEGRQAAVRLLCMGVCFLPSLLMAHPGHYHPDETDEFDFFHATFFHTHGALEYVLAGLVVASIMVFFFNRKPAVRLCALVTAVGSLLLPLL
ncbi:MAG: hypothetical protein ABI162_11225 [Luteolibacter sp.]